MTDNPISKLTTTERAAWYWLRFKQSVLKLFKGKKKTTTARSVELNTEELLQELDKIHTQIIRLIKSCKRSIYLSSAVLAWCSFWCAFSLLQSLWVLSAFNFALLIFGVSSLRAAIRNFENATTTHVEFHVEEARFQDFLKATGESDL